MVITLTERAAGQIKAIATQKELPNTPCLRVGVKGGGCSGFTYTLDLCDEPSKGDEVFEAHDIRIVCDPKSYLYLNGTEVDFNDEILGGGFVFNNPNAKSSCGCGASFQA